MRTQLRFGSLVGGLPLLLILVGSGCSGDPDAIAATPVAGTVLMKGKPLAAGNIQFIPATGRSAGGVIKDGQFSLTTYEPGDGAIPGSHKVVIVGYKDLPNKSGTETEQKLVTPQKYSAIETTDLTIEVPAGGKKDLEIKIE